MSKFTREEVEAAFAKVRKAMEFGGPHVAEVRKWIQHTFQNGDRVRWGSNEFLHGTSLTVKEVEDMAIRASEAAMDEIKTRTLNELKFMAQFKQDDA